MANIRAQRVASQLQQTISQKKQKELQNPIFTEQLVTVVDVRVSADLSVAKVYFSVLASKQKQQEVMQALNEAKKFIRNEIASRLNMRITPELRFELDTLVEKGEKLIKLIDEVNDK